MARRTVGMSPVFTWRSAICQSSLSPTARHVAFTLSIYMNERGGSAFPGGTLLAHDTGLHLTTVKRALSELEDAGYLGVEERGGALLGGLRHATKYVAIIPTTGSTEVPVTTASTEVPVAQDSRPVAEDSLTGSTERPQDDIESDKKATNTPDAFGDEFVTLWNVYPRTDDSTKARKAYSSQRLAGVSAEDLLMATVNYRQFVEAQKYELRHIKQGKTFFGGDEPYRDFLQPVESPTTEVELVDDTPRRMASARALGKSRSHWDESKLRDQPIFESLPPDEQDEVIAGWRGAQTALVAL